MVAHNALQHDTIPSPRSLNHKKACNYDRTFSFVKAIVAHVVWNYRLNYDFLFVYGGFVYKID